MKKSLAFLSFCLLFSCTTRKQMNEMAFSDVSMGMTEKQLVEVAGKPYDICKHKDGSLEYQYIERFEGPKRRIMQVNYYITVKKGTVTHKRVEKTYPPGWMYDSLDYQSKNEGNQNGF